MNRCDVNGSECNRAECKGECNTDNCVFFWPQEYSNKCAHYHCGYCSNLAAIRAAIEAERNHIVDANKKVGD